MSEAEQKSHFERLAAINVNEQVEKKGGLSYLSWAWAVDRLLRADPEAEWSYGDIQYFPDRTALVWCTVKAFGKSKREKLPVMDHRNKPIAEPDAFQINTAMQRCLVKAIALHGLGLYIYAGEDLPPGEEPKEVDNETGEAPAPPQRRNSAAQVCADAFDALADELKDEIRTHASEVQRLHSKRGDVVGYLAKQGFDDEHKMALWHCLPSHVRSWIKDQEKIARMHAIARAMPSPEELGSQA